MILGFKKQFVEKILDGSKKHTIREDKHDRWKPCVPIQFATGIRTKYYNQFKSDDCKSIQYVTITRSHNDICPEFKISVDGRILDAYECYDLAINDGFDFLNDLLEWFIPLKELNKLKNKEMSFSGKIIHWTDFRY